MQTTKIKSLNPYFNGKYFLSEIPHYFEAHDIPVLILILMENTF